MPFRSFILASFLVAAARLCRTAPNSGSVSAECRCSGNQFKTGDGMKTNLLAFFSVALLLIAVSSVTVQAEDPQIWSSP
jgi:hypothetical protein